MQNALSIVVVIVGVQRVPNPAMSARRKSLNVDSPEIEKRDCSSSFEPGIESERLFYPWEHEVDEGSGTDELTRLFAKAKKSALKAVQDWTVLQWIGFFLPCVRWLKSYTTMLFVFDLIAGVSVGFMVVPQGIAYASSAGVPSVFGLYGAFLPCIVYSLMGTSRQLSVGPVAVTSLLIYANLQSLIPCASSISNPNTVSTPEDIACQNTYNDAAIQVAFIVACLYTAIGLLRMGWIMKFLSHSVISGFMTGAAVTIGIGQVKYVLGYSISMGSSTALQNYIQQYAANIWQLRWQEYIMGITCMFVLVFFKYMDRLWKPLKYIRSFGPLFVFVIGIGAVYIGNVDKLRNGGLATIGNIPAGLPPWTAGIWSFTDSGPSFTALMPTCVVVLFVDLLESTSIARALARKNGYELDYNREIVGLGLANFAGAMSSCYSTTGSFSRSAVADNAGAKTPMAQFVCGWVVAFVLIFLTNFFSRVPKNILGSIIIVSVSSLVEYEQAIYLWKVNKTDLLVWLAACSGVLFYSVEVGLAIAIGLAVLLVMYQAAFPHTAVLGRLSNSANVYRNIKQYPDAQMIPGILAFRIDAPLFYGNVKGLEDRIERLIMKYSNWSKAQGAERLEFLLLDMTPIHHVDSMGLHFLEDLVFSMRAKGITLVLANPNHKVVRAWSSIKLPELLGKDNIFVSIHDAVIFAQQRLSEKGICTKTVSIVSRIPSSSDSKVI
ncbi:hypothetical protein CEUSTIGMA_g11636.t1 [Chlamydomonas eustigma]|uniref:STAS domain-containing protein n=1 Tax=Chlamydomonas eustigma TaxID=1157962 RepID=A0A250XMG0_9CHLO|nr:hypothetical protein CEUSTIGMA_g11636.t1 [Chlamydomonas eustigma]|eukprot:GAX84213.1 hypothetical protein CEUSTIGMA_g11636.t1 [Chlamydomonas eustigma]